MDSRRSVLLLVAVIAVAGGTSWYRLREPAPVKTWQSSAPSSRTDRDEWHYDDEGQPHGTHREFAPDGRVIRQTQWEHGEQVGEVVYDENGTIRRRVDRDGNVSEFDAHGQPIMR